MSFRPAAPRFFPIVLPWMFCLAPLAYGQSLARFVDGPPQNAELVACDDHWQVTLAVGGKSRTLPAAALVRWGALTESPGPLVVVLADGGTLCARAVHWTDDQFTVEGISTAPVRLPAELVAGVVFSPLRDALAEEMLLVRLRDPAASEDRLILDNDDELAGTLIGLADGKIEWQTAAGKSEIPLARASALAMHPATLTKSRLSGPRAYVGLADGSSLTAASLAVSGKEAKLRILGGVELNANAADVAALQPLGGSIRYLSDLKPAGYKHIPALQLAWPYQLDRNVLGGPLVVNAARYLKGIGLHSAARIHYDLERPFRRLDAELAIDDAAEGRGSVEVRVFVDLGDGRWHNRFASEIVRGKASPQSMSVDLTGAKRVSVLVDFAERGDERDYADLLDARLIP